MGGLLAALASGLIFGLGLQIAGMTDPQRVLGFLDIFGAWNPNLAVMMAAAVGVTFVGYLIAGRRERPVFAPQSAWPTKRTLDRDLLAGAVIFGAGWGLVGLCPGPALVNLATLSPPVLGFFVAMVVGLFAVDAWRRVRAPDTKIAASRRT